MKKIDTIDPRLKLLWCLLLILTALLANHILTEVCLLALILVTDGIFTRNFRKYKALVAVFLLVASQVFLMQLLFGREGEVIAEWWIISIYSGSVPAATMGTLRTMAVSLAAIQMFGWTSAEDAVLMLRSFHVPYRYAMLVTMAQRFFPLLKEEYQTILESQKVRGVETDTIAQKLRVLPLTFLPFLYRALRRTSDIALSMELRGFGYCRERTFPKELHCRPPELCCGILLLALFILCNGILHL